MVGGGQRCVRRDGCWLSLLVAACSRWPESRRLCRDASLSSAVSLSLCVGRDCQTRPWRARGWTYCFLSVPTETSKSCPFVTKGRTYFCATTRGSNEHRRHCHLVLHHLLRVGRTHQQRTGRHVFPQSSQRDRASRLCSSVCRPIPILTMYTMNQVRFTSVGSGAVQF